VDFGAILTQLYSLYNPDKLTEPNFLRSELINLQSDLVITE
jgi:hypothetical protein